MPNQVTGRLAAIDRAETITLKNGTPFQKREFMLNAATYDPHTGQPSQYDNMLRLELTGERCADLDRFRAGDVVTVCFTLQGRSWQGADGQVRHMVSVRCYKIEPYRQQQQQSQAPVPSDSPRGGGPQPLPSGEGAGGAAPQLFPPTVDAEGNPQKDDLPF